MKENFCSPDDLFSTSVSYFSFLVFAMFLKGGDNLLMGQPFGLPLYGLPTFAFPVTFKLCKMIYGR